MSARGLNAQVLDRLIDEAAFDEKAKKLGLAMSNDTIAETVRSDPRLKGSDGQFDRARFEGYLRDAGITEKAFFSQQRYLYLREQIEYALVDSLAAPKTLVDALLATKNQTREIAYFTLPPAAAGAIPAPSDDTLKTFFETHKALWRAPELRSFDALPVTPASLAKPADVSEADARAQYDKDKDAKYTVAEKRKLQQIVFPNETEAAEADGKIKNGTSFDDIAKARKLTDADLDIGEVTKQGAFDPAIAAAAFALPQGGVSGPIKGPFGFALVRVVSITPGEVKPFEAVEPAIRQEIATARAGDQVQALHDRIEEAKGSGKSVADAARSVGLEAKSFAGVDAQGRDAAGASVDVFQAKQILPAVFASDVGVDDEAISTPDKGYVWFSVTKVDPAHDRGFDEVKDKVAATWRAEETAKRLADAAGEIVKKLDAGGDPAELAKAANAELKTAKDIRRAGGGGLTPQVVSAVFAVGAAQAGSLPVDDGRLVFKVTADAVPPAAAGDPDAATTVDRIKGDMSRSLVEQYVDAIKQQIGVSIDQKALQSAEGG